MAQTAKKIFMIILTSQAVVLLAYVVLRHHSVNFAAWQLTSSGELLFSPQNATEQRTYSLLYTENISKSAGVSSKSRVTESASAGMRSGGGMTIRSIQAKGPTTPRKPVAEFTTERIPLEGLKTKGSFQQIDDQQAWMYSAHFDYVTAEQGRPTVRIFGIVRRDLLKTVYCNFSISGGSLINASTVIELPDSHGVNFPPSYVECRLPAKTRPTHVSISLQLNNTSTNRLEVIYPGNRSRNFTVCYSILHSGFNAASQLIQSIEMNRILGAEHFMVYNYSISPAVDQILRRYQQDGLVTVLPWPVPTRQSWYYGQMTALNDCFYRNRNISRFVVVVDTDEFMIPYKHSSWMEVLHETSPKEQDVSTFLHPPAPSEKEQVKTGCFIVLMSFFAMNSRTNWTSLPSEFPFSAREKNNTLKYKIFTLSQFLRAAKINRPKIKSKYIARPELTFNSGIHYVHKLVNSAQSVVVPSNISLIHHYRQRTTQGEIVDTSILRFKSQLYQRVMEKYNLFPEIFT